MTNEFFNYIKEKLPDISLLSFITKMEQYENKFFKKNKATFK